MVEPRTFFRALGAQRAALTPDVRAVAPTTIGWPIWPAIDRARPFECHRTITHVTAAAVGVCWHHPWPERLRLAPCHRWCRTCDSPTHYWDFSSNQRELATPKESWHFCNDSVIIEWGIDTCERGGIGFSFDVKFLDEPSKKRRRDKTNELI